MPSSRAEQAILDALAQMEVVDSHEHFGSEADRLAIYGTEALEKIYGHLVMARENVASVLAGRVDQGRMSTDEALRIARLWFWDNPKDLYRLNVDTRTVAGRQ